MYRHFLAVAGAAALLLTAAGAPLRAYEYQQIFGQPLVGMEGRPRAVAPPRELVAYIGRYAPGTIVISTEERRLYYILPGNQVVTQPNDSLIKQSPMAVQKTARVAAKMHRRY